ncbi:hypothetical protein A8924_0124 [Saccharopolyspora erythraea NRRL 2338]|nr:hypothetical protein [Saccharopolyspora erythraea]EQD86654.1 hypothetical protein N599_08530 [Saccharopolyspora erythraea D]PFG92900.1 hypothetical protein A8924_0124 [Saccharopolyspora erythraea NRRL 2338]QRK89802.1 hypothetical protein JQX30_35760 [Saccharopolyspora erythraea]
MRTLFDGEVHVHYGQIYVQSEIGALTLEEHRAGQSNGLCGAAVPGQLFLTTGLHTGHVGFTVEVHDERPDVDEAWEEAVEASFRPLSPEVALVEWGGEAAWSLDLEEIDYRVRYCAVAMDESRRVDTRTDGEPMVDRYLLQFWPAPPGPDAVVKQTSVTAEYWHQVARSLPPPPTPEEKAEAERERRLEEERRREEVRARAEAESWAGRAPSERLRQAGGHAWAMAQLDRDLVDEIADLDADAQRSLARWAVRRAYELAGLDGIDWIAPALAALEQGRELPPPFDDKLGVWEVLLNDPRVPHTTVTLPDRSTENFLQQAAALPAIFGATEDDPLSAAFEALHSAAGAFGTDYPDLFAEVRREFTRRTP